MEPNGYWIFSLQLANSACPEEKFIHQLRSVLISSISLFLEMQRHLLPSCTTAKHILTSACRMVYQCFHRMIFGEEERRQNARDTMAMKITNLAKCCLYYYFIIFKSLVHTHRQLTVTLLSAHGQVTVISRITSVHGSYSFPLSQSVCSHRRSH